MTFRTIIIGAAMAATITTGATAAPSERVSYRDLDLASAEGQAELQGRLDSAARRVCRFDERGQLVTPDEENACYRAARKTADVRFAELIDSTIQRGG